MPGTRPQTATVPVRIMRPGEKRSASRTATRALDVLELLGATRGPVRAVEVTRALGLTPSTTNQLLKTMVDSGHLVFDARSKTYLPSPRLAPFGSWIAGLYGVDADLHRLLEEIQRELDLVVTLSAPNDLYMQIIDSAIPPGRSAERGLRISLFGSAIGSACLAMVDDAEIARLAYRARLGDAQVAATLDEVRAIRRSGFSQGASADGELWSVAVPIRIDGLQGPAVLGLAGPIAAIRERAPSLARHLADAFARYRMASAAFPGS